MKGAVRQLTVPAGEPADPHLENHASSRARNIIGKIAGRSRAPWLTMPYNPGTRYQLRCTAQQHALSRCSRLPTAPRRPRSTGTTAPPAGTRSHSQPRTVGPATHVTPRLEATYPAAPGSSVVTHSAGPLNLSQNPFSWTKPGRRRPCRPLPSRRPFLNGHRVTEEVCAALRSDRPDRAADFVFEDLVAMAGEMGHPPQRPRRRTRRRGGREGGRPGPGAGPPADRRAACAPHAPGAARRTRGGVVRRTEYVHTTRRSARWGLGPDRVPVLAPDEGGGLCTGGGLGGRAGGPGPHLAVPDRAHQPVRRLLHTRARDQPEAYDPKLDVDFTPLREQDLTVACLGQAAQQASGTAS